ncbi:hypothetical protein FSP39_022064 [Pinctada imbricata]|uniref:P-type domain-containing protein n=1 Tax=Pinctada imbricata TaxID=66713 RepID=A0AA88YBI8_PINIB|nr:hypothetical protein FSP39_022064 [Pinctada imbricata]
MASKHARNNMGRVTFFMCVLFLIALAAIIMSAIVLKRSLDEDDEDNATPQVTVGAQQAQSNIKTQTSGPLPQSTTHRSTTTQIPDSRTDSVVDCHPKNPADSSPRTQTECEKRGCTWQSPSNSKEPRCIFPPDKGYAIQGQPVLRGNTYTATLKRKGIASMYGMDVYPTVSVTVEMYHQKAIRIYMKPVVTPGHWEIPDKVLKVHRPTNSQPFQDYDVKFIQDPVFGIVITRKSTGAVIFDTALPGMVFTKQFLQITTRLPSDNVYGFGEHNHRRFRHDTNWKTWPIFTRDCAPVDEWNLYSAHPVHMALENDGNSSMVFLKNSHAMDVTLQPDPHPAITYRVIGGVFDFYIFTGPSPQEAVQQYLEGVGRPPMPPYWALGFHLCRYGYGNLTRMKEVYKRNMDAEIPMDTQWGDIDYMYKKYMFTVDKNTFLGLPEFVNELHKAGQKFVVILDPGIGSNQTLIKEAKSNSPGYEVYEDASFKGVLIRNPNNSGPLVGKVWPGRTVYPDFTDTGAPAFWETWIRYFINSENISVDGLWIDMNEPSNFVAGSVDGCDRNSWNNPPYVPPILEGDKDNGTLVYKTLCMDSRHRIGRHYEVHSLYGHMDAIATHKALSNIRPGKRPFILTRSSFAGTGKYSFKWLGDNGSHWPHMHWSIVGLLEFSMFGFALNGADICGFWDPAEYEMCLRWFQLGAFYPFSRSHNIEGQPDQDPAVWGDMFIMIVRHALLVRYKLLPYYYTVFKDAAVYGKTVTRPLMFEFPEDKNTWDIDRQFLIGSNFLVSPVLEKGKRSVDAYFPKGRWFSFYDGKEVTYEMSEKVSTLPAPLGMINIHSRGGSIIPVQEPGNTTQYSRLNPMGLWVSLDEEWSAKGELYMDDGESVDSYETGKYLLLKFNMTKGEALDITVVHNGYTPPGNLYFGIIEFYGMPSFPGRLSIDGKRFQASHIRSKFYIVQLIDIQLDIIKNHQLRWTVF